MKFLKCSSYLSFRLYFINCCSLSQEISSLKNRRMLENPKNVYYSRDHMFCICLALLLNFLFSVMLKHFIHNFEFLTFIKFISGNIGPVFLGPTARAEQQPSHSLLD